MMYLPYKDGNPDLVRLFVEMFGLVMPERVAEEVVKRDVKMIVDPVTKDLVQIIMPFMSKSEIMTLSVDQGWVTRATVEDVKLLPGVHREVFRLEGGEWVSREIVQHVQAGRAKFVINSGDVVWWGNQGLTINDSPYWKRLNDSMLKLLPEGARRRARRTLVHVCRQSRGVGRSEDRRCTWCCALSEKIRRHAGTVDL